MRPLHVVVALVSCALALVGCHACDSDAERAAAERAAIDEKLRKSLPLFPYRFVKLAVRSAESPDRPKAVDNVIALIDETQALPAHADSPEAVATEVATFARLAVALHAARDGMLEKDEDDYPLFATQYLEAPPPPPYDEPMEHLATAAFWLIVDSADRSQKVPGGTDFVFYELSRAPPQPSWPRGVALLAWWMRGAAFCAATAHHAAEEELNAYVAEVGRLDAGTLGPFFGRDAGLALHLLRAFGFFTRAWNRMELKRDDAATDDVEMGLKELEALGIDNELTWWGWALVHAQRERPAESAVYLDKLASSPHLDEEVRAELAAAATELRATQKIPVLLKARAFVIVAQALLTRAGGVEGLLVTVLGPDEGRRLAEPLHWLARVRVALVTAPAAAARGALEAGKALGARGVEGVKNALPPLPKLPALPGSTTPAPMPPSP